LNLLIWSIISVQFLCGDGVGQVLAHRRDIETSAGDIT
jgi:hypothetical protein